MSRRSLFRLWLLTIVACLVNARTVKSQGDPHPLKPADTCSPRATLQSFVENMNSMYGLLKDEGHAADASQQAIFHMRAVRCLDLSEIDPAAVEDLGAKRAVLLTEILDRIELPPLNAIPDADEASTKEITRWRIPETEISIVKIPEGPREGEYLFSTDTIRRIPEFYDRAKGLPYRPGTVLEDAFERLFTQAPPAAAETNPLEPAATDSPQATLRTFLDNLNAVFRSFRAHGMSPPAVAERQASLNRAIRRARRPARQMNGSCHDRRSSPTGTRAASKMFATLQVVMRQNMIQSYTMNSVGVQPADFIIAPDVTSFDISEFTRADEMALIGERTVHAAAGALQRMLARLDPKLFA